MTAAQVHNLCRALTPPYPGAFTFLGGAKIVVWKTRLLRETVIGPPGRIALRRPEGVIVTALDRGLLIESIQPEGAPAPLPASSCLKIRGDTFE
jgi:methionyl-tRNA formyltransferase